MRSEECQNSTFRPVCLPFTLQELEFAVKHSRNVNEALWYMWFYEAYGDVSFAMTLAQLIVGIVGLIAFVAKCFLQ